MFLFLVAFISLSAASQITYNAKIGAGFSNVYGGDYVEYSSKFVGKIGFGIEKPLSSNFSFMPSIEVALKGTKSSEEFFGEKEELDVNLWYIQMPLLVTYRINLTDSWNSVLKVGPYLAYGFSGKVKDNYSVGGEMEKDDYDFFSDENGNRFDAGLVFGLDFEYHRYVIGAEYELGLTKLQKNFGEKMGAFYITLGYKF